MNFFMDKLLKPIYDKLGVCWDLDGWLEDSGMRKDEHGDPLITDC